MSHLVRSVTSPSGNEAGRDEGAKHDDNEEHGSKPANLDERLHDRQKGTRSQEGDRVALEIQIVDQFASIDGTKQGQCRPNRDADAADDLASILVPRMDCVAEKRKEAK
jgi:hypothetical protein